MEQNLVIVGGVQPRRQHRPSRGLLLLWALILSVLYVLIVRIAIPSLPDTVVAAETAQNNSQQPMQSVETYSVSTPELSNTTQQVACTGASFMQQGGLDLTTLSDGVHIVKGDPEFYTVTGTSLNEIRQAIDACAYRQPAGDYHALTRYQLNWQYSFVHSHSTCKLDHTKVGMRISMLLPRLGNNANQSSTTLSTWQAYDTKLRAHETGHVTINERHAQVLYQKLNSLRTTTCAELETSAKHVIALQLAALNTDHESYDTHTDHGATQGARL